MPSHRLSAIRCSIDRGLASARQYRVRAGDTGPTESHETARVAVIVPIFNGMPYLETLLDSLSDQDLPDDQYEIILVDDGSTDAGPTLMNRHQVSSANLRVIRQRNSGWPGQPRNRGLSVAKAPYVFFADADDVLAPHALRSLLDYAEAAEADVVLPKMSGLNGRPTHQKAYSATLPDAPLEVAMISLSPQKLIRRELIERAGINFPVGKVRLEDGIFMTACYLSAERIAILADDDYYFLRARDDAMNISARRASPKAYTNSVVRIAAQISAAALPDEQRERLLLNLYERKILRFYAPSRFSEMTSGRRSAWVKAHQRFRDSYISSSMQERLAFPARLRSSVLQAADPSRQLVAARLERLLQQPWHAVRCVDKILSVAVQDAGTFPERATLLLRPRGGGRDIAVQMYREGPAFHAPLPTSGCKQ